MALALRFYATINSHDGITDVIQLFKEGFVGSGVEIEFGALDGDPARAIEEGTGDEGDDLFTPSTDSFRRVSFSPKVSGSFNQAALDGLRAISTATSREYMMIHLRGGAEAWRGWVMPENTTTQVIDALQHVDVYAKVRLKSLSNINYTEGLLAATKLESARVLLTDMLTATGISKDLVEGITAAPTAETGDPLDVKINRNRFWEQREEEEDFDYASKLQVVESIARAFLGRLVYYADAWRMCYPLAYLTGPSVTTRTYNTSGVKQSAGSITSTIDLTNQLFITDSDLIYGDDPVKQARVTYDTGPAKIGEFTNGNFELWTDPTVAPTGWTYTGAGGEFRRGDGINAAPGPDPVGNRYALEMKEAITTGVETPTLAQMRAQASNWMSQDVGQFISTDTDVRLSWWHELTLEATTIPEIPDGVQAFVRVKLVGSSNTYYWVGSGTDHEGSFSIVSGDAAKHPNVDVSQFNFGKEDWIEIATFPETGTVTIEVGQCVRGDIDFRAGDNTVWCKWDNVKLVRDSSTATGESQIIHVITDANLIDGVVTEVLSPIGDGPFVMAEGAMFLSDGTTLTSDWKRNSSATAVAHTKMLALEYIGTNRTSRPHILFTSNGAVSGLRPDAAFTFDGTRYWPLLIRTTRPTGQTELVGVKLQEDLTGTTDSTESASGTGVFVGGGGTASIYTDTLRRLGGELGRLATTTLTATLAAGAQTSCTINPVTGVFKDNEPFAIVDLVTGETYNLQVNGEYDGSSTLNFDSNTFDHPVKTGSYVYHDQEESFARLTITENVISASVQAGELCQVTETLTSEARTSINVDGLNYDVANNDVFKLIRNNGGPTLTLVATSDQNATSTTFAFDDGAGGSVSITCVSGDSIVPDVAFMNAQLVITPNAVRLEVEAQLDKEKLGTLAQSYSGSTTSLNLTAGSLYPVHDNQTLYVGTFADKDWQTVTVNGDQAAGTDPIVIDSISLTQSSGAEVIVPGGSEGAQIVLNRDNILLRVSQTDYDADFQGGMVARLDGSHSTASRSTISVTGVDGTGGNDIEVDANSIIVVIDKGSGKPGFARVTATEAVGSTSFAVEDIDGTTLNFPVTMDDESPIYIYAVTPDIQASQISIALNSITLSSDLILFNTNAVLRNGASDWQITEDGFCIQSDTVLSDARSYQIKEGTTDRMNLWHDLSNNVVVFVSTESMTLSADDFITINGPDIVTIDASNAGGIVFLLGRDKVEIGDSSSAQVLAKFDLVNRRITFGDDSTAGFMPTGEQIHSVLALDSGDGVAHLFGGTVNASTDPAQVLEGYLFINHASGVLSLALSGIFHVEVDGAGDVTEARGVTSQLNLNAGGDVSKWYGFFSTFAGTGPGDVTTEYTSFKANGVPSGFVTGGAYALHIPASSNYDFALLNEDPAATIHTHGAILLEEMSSTPTPPTNSGTQMYINLKSNKLVVNFNDGGTQRYKYLDLTGTGVTWVHTTTPP